MDPFTIAAIAKLGSGLVQGIGDSRAAKRQGEFYGDIRTEGEEQSKRLEGERQGLYGLGPTMRRYMQYTMQDPTADLQRQEAQRQSGTAVEALKSGGARAILGGLNAQQQRNASLMANIGASEYARKTSALQTIGTEEQRLQGAKRADVNADLLAARQQAATGMAGQFQASQDQKSALNNLLAGGIGAAGSLGAMNAANNQNFDPDKLQQLLGFMGKYGAKVKKTPGSFSHERNPLDVMQGQKKVGELTGGEYVLNPEQAARVAKQSQYAAKLFRKFDSEER